MDKYSKKSIYDLNNINIKVKDLPSESRPREMLRQRGVKSLSDAELLALLIDTGTKNMNVIALSTKLIDFAGGLDGLFNMELEQLLKIKGIGLSKASKIMAAFELGARASLNKTDREKPVINCPENAVNIFYRNFDLEKVEVFKCVMLNAKNNVIGHENIAKGMINQVLVSPREIFAAALSKNAAAIIIMHNHPSGDPVPSNDDKLLTKKIAGAGSMLGIPLIDHIIYGSKEKYYSFKQEGLL